MINDIDTIHIRMMSDVSGISIPNIRIWEKRYNLFNPNRTSTNIRKYTLENLAQIILIKYLLDSGYRIGELGNYNLSEMRCLVFEELGKESLNYFEKQKLITLLIEENVDVFDEFVKICLEDVMSVDFIVKALEPVMRLLPVISNLTDNNIHYFSFVANKVMLRMLASVDDIVMGGNKNLEMLLFQSDENHIPVNLSIVNYLANFKKYKTNIILNRVPSNYFASLKKEINPDIIYTEFNEKQKLVEIITLLSNLQTSFPSSRIIVSGSRMEKIWKEVPNKIYFTRSIEVLLKSL